MLDSCIPGGLDPGFSFSIVLYMPHLKVTLLLFCTIFHDHSDIILNWKGLYKTVLAVVDINYSEESDLN